MLTFRPISLRRNSWRNGTETLLTSHTLIVSALNF